MERTTILKRISTSPRIRLRSSPLWILLHASIVLTVSIHNNALQRPQSMLSIQPPLRRLRQHHFSVITNDCPYNPPPQYTVDVSSDQILSRSEAVQLLDTHVLPIAEKGYRMNLNVNDIIDSSIDMDSSTYGELSLTSVDVILDRIAQEFIHGNTEDAESTTREGSQGSLKIIDIGSGCGRLVLYMAIAQQGLQQYYDNVVVTGIEQSKALYEESIRATERLLQYNSANEHINAKQDHHDQFPNSQIKLYCGPANDFLHEIHTADIIICYSTAFSSGEFLPSISALLLSQEWNAILTPPSPRRLQHHPTASTKSTLYCVTMDKALDPSRGWTMVDRINVPNPEIGVESTAFLQKIDRHV